VLLALSDLINQVLIKSENSRNMEKISLWKAVRWQFQVRFDWNDSWTRQLDRPQPELAQLPCGSEQRFDQVFNSFIRAFGRRSPTLHFSGTICNGLTLPPGRWLEKTLEWSRLKNILSSAPIGKWSGGLRTINIDAGPTGRAATWIQIGFPSKPLSQDSSSNWSQFGWSGREKVKIWLRLLFRKTLWQSIFMSNALITLLKVEGHLPSSYSGGTPIGSERPIDWKSVSNVVELMTELFFRFYQVQLISIRFLYGNTFPEDAAETGENRWRDGWIVQYLKLPKACIIRESEYERAG